MDLSPVLRIVLINLYRKSLTHLIKQNIRNTHQIDQIIVIMISLLAIFRPSFHYCLSAEVQTDRVKPAEPIVQQRLQPNFSEHIESLPELD